MKKETTKAAEVMKNLAAGNQSFIEARSEEYFAKHQKSQTPALTLVICSDSRVHTPALLEDPVNHIFTIENIGNQLATSPGSVDYGVYHLKTPILMIMGHADCGAIKAFTGGYQGEPADIQKELDSMKPAFDLFRSGKHEEGEGGFDMEILARVQHNVDFQVKTALERYRQQVDSGELTVVGAFYDFWNACGKGYGRSVVVNVNGETDPGKLGEHPVFHRFSAELKELVAGRVL